MRFRSFIKGLVFLFGFIGIAWGCDPEPDCQVLDWIACGSGTMQPGNITDGYGTPITTLCKPWQGPITDLGRQFDDWRIGATAGYDTYTRWSCHLDSSCSTTSTGVYCGDSVGVTFPYPSNVTINNPGDSIVTARWKGTCNDDVAYKTLTLTMWTTEYPCYAGDSIMPGNITKNGSNFDNQTTWEVIRTSNMYLYDYMTSRNISVSVGSDTDWRFTITRNDNCTASTTTTKIADTVTISTSGTINLTTPGLYTITFTWVDQHSPPCVADSVHPSKSFYVCVFKVEITKPTDSPHPIALNCQDTCIATVTPTQALGGSYTWSIDSGAGDGYFSYINNSTTLFTATEVEYDIGTVFYKVTYTKGGATAYSDEKEMIVFMMNLIALSFTDDHDIQSNSTTIVDPVWTSTKNDPVCYTKNSNIIMTGKFVITPALPVSANIYIQALDDDENENLNAYQNISISGITTDISGILSENTLYDKVHVRVLTYEWQYSTDYAYWNTAGYTGNKIYVVLSVPKAPMATPWTEVLEEACYRAEGANTEFSVASSITQSIYNSGAIYDGNDWHYTYPNPSNSYDNFYLKALLNQLYSPATMDCRDFANLTHVATNSLGLSAQYNVIKGNGDTFHTRDILAAQGSWEPTDWHFHQVGWWNSKVCDASLQLDISTTGSHIGKQSQGDMSFSEYITKLTVDTTVHSLTTGIANSFYFPADLPSH